MRASAQAWRTAVLTGAALPPPPRGYFFQFEAFFQTEISVKSFISIASFSEAPKLKFHQPNFTNFNHLGKNIPACRPPCYR